MTAKIDALGPRPPAAGPDRFPGLTARSEERPLLLVAVILAVLAHGLALLVDLPRRTPPPPPPPRAEGPVIYETDLPPPPLRQPTTPPPRQDTTRRIFLPAEDPTEVGPVVEPMPDVPDGPVFEPEIDLVVVEPAAPPVVGPVPIDPSITPPRVIDSTKVKPVYPEIGRIAGLAGRVVLQAVIRRDGRVAEIEVLQVRPPGLGFEEAAIDAVARWRYEPARQNGRPVEVYFTIVVTFDLQ